MGRKVPTAVQQKRTSEQKSPREKNRDSARKRKKAQLYAVSQLAVIPATMLPHHRFSGDGKGSSESSKTSERVREYTRTGITSILASAKRSGGTTEHDWLCSQTTSSCKIKAALFTVKK